MTIAFAQQSNAASTASGTTASRTLVGVQANSLLIFPCTNREPADHIDSMTDDVNITGWENIPFNTDSNTTANLWYRRASAAGTIIATATFNQALGSPAICNFIEFTATGTVILYASATNDNAAGTSHSHGSCDISGAGLLIATCSLNGGDSSGYSAATNYTKLDVGGGLRIMDQYRIATGLLSGETATWSSGADSIATAAIIASFIESSGGISTAWWRA